MNKLLIIIIIVMIMTTTTTTATEETSETFESNNLENLSNFIDNDKDDGNHSSNDNDKNESFIENSINTLLSSIETTLNESLTTTTNNNNNNNNIMAQYNCTPIVRNDTAKLIVVNSTSTLNYFELKNYFIADLFFMNHTNTNNNNNNNNNNNGQQQQQQLNKINDTNNNNDTMINTGNDTNNNNNTSSSSSNGQCTILIFYYNWCRFSATAAPNFNAIGRLFPQMYIMAIDAYYHYSLTIRFGVSGVPSIYFLYNGRPVSKYNRTDITVDGLIEFIHSLTSYKPIITVNNMTNIVDNFNETIDNNNNNTSNNFTINNDDRLGPLFIQYDDQQNYLLLFCWKFCIIVLLYHFFRSNIFHKIKDHIRAMWNEWAAAQQHHEHND